MGISFGKRKVKIKLLGQTETATEEEKPKVPVPIYQPETVSKAKPKVNRTFKEALKEITEQSKNLFQRSIEGNNRTIKKTQFIRHYGISVLLL